MEYQSLFLFLSFFLVNLCVSIWFDMDKNVNESRDTDSWAALQSLGRRYVCCSYFPTTLWNPGGDVRQLKTGGYTAVLANVLWWPCLFVSTIFFLQGITDWEGCCLWEFMGSFQRKWNFSLFLTNWLSLALPCCYLTPWSNDMLLTW